MCVRAFLNGVSLVAGHEERGVPRVVRIVITERQAGVGGLESDMGVQAVRECG